MKILKAKSDWHDFSYIGRNNPSFNSKYVAIPIYLKYILKIFIIKDALRIIKVYIKKYFLGNSTERNIQ
jgi:hypothetical protein